MASSNVTSLQVHTTILLSIELPKKDPIAGLLLCTYLIWSRPMSALSRTDRAVSIFTTVSGSVATIFRDCFRLRFIISINPQTRTVGLCRAHLPCPHCLLTAYTATESHGTVRIIRMEVWSTGPRGLPIGNALPSSQHETQTQQRVA